MKKLIIPIALLLLTLNSCTPGGVDPDPEPSDSTTTYPIPNCAYTFTYVVTSERKWKGGYLNGHDGWEYTNSASYPTYFTFTDSIWSIVTGPRVEISRGFRDTLPMNVNVKIYYDDILVKNVTKLLKNISAADPHSSYLTVYGGNVFKCN